MLLFFGRVLDLYVENSIGFTPVSNKKFLTCMSKTIASLKGMEY